MMPTSHQIAMQIVVMHEKYPKLTVSEIASSLMLSPIFVINALEVGEQMGVLKRIKDKKGKLTDKLEPMPELIYSDLVDDILGTENNRIQDELFTLIKSANQDGDDIEEGTLNYWTRGIKPSEIELALHFLLKIGALAKYELSDPKDKKSKYTFYTLSENEGKQWGIKQFKKAKK